MPKQVCNGAILQCTMGTTPSSLLVPPRHRVQTERQEAANISDHVPIVNVASFGACNSIANPVVASATAAKLGVFTPMPCVPNTPAPWVAGAPTVSMDMLPTLDDISKLACTWGGVISVTDAGEHSVDVP